MGVLLNGCITFADGGCIVLFDAGDPSVQRRLVSHDGDARSGRLCAGNSCARLAPSSRFCIA
jgi:hypothetical protein